MRFASLWFLVVLTLLSGCSQNPEKTIEDESTQSSEIVVTDKVYLKPTFTVDNGESKDPISSRKRHWSVLAQSNLRLTVDDWATKAGYVVYFETDRQVVFQNIQDISIPADSFIDALDLLFRSISLPSKGIRYAVYEDSRTVRIFSKGGV
ncbi:MAG: TcpQ domain-containing protein [Methyloprofundus sp.]|nr:TcpQ domain-containing protein [Methyloprofundus sp.]